MRPATPLLYGRSTARLQNLEAYYSALPEYADRMKEITGKGNDSIFGSASADPSFEAATTLGHTVRYDGDDQSTATTWATLNTLGSPTVPISVFAWMEVMALNSAWQATVEKGWTSSGPFWLMGFESGTNKWHVAVVGGASFTPVHSLQSPSAATTGVHHVGFVRNAGFFGLYVDGAQVASRSDVGSNNPTNASNLRFGMNGGGSEPSNVRIATVEIYSRAVGAAEIADMYARPWIQHYPYGARACAGDALEII